MNYLFPAICSLLSFGSALYLFRQWHSQQLRSLPTLFWAMALSVYSVSNGLTVMLIAKTVSYPSLSYDFVWVARMFLAANALVLMYAGTARLMTHRRLTYLVFPVIVLIASLVYPILWRSFGNTPDDIIFSYSWIFLFPLSLILGIVFAMLYGILVAEESGKNIGALLIAISWIGYAIQVVFLPQAAAQGQLNFWYIFRILTMALLLVGLILLERESRHFFKVANNDRAIRREHFR